MLNALDIPDKTGILEAIDEQQAQIEQSQPPINMDVELAAKLFKDMPLECQLQYLAQFGFQVPKVNEAVEVEQAQNAKITDKGGLSEEVITNGILEQQGADI